MTNETQNNIVKATGVLAARFDTRTVGENDTPVCEAIIEVPKLGSFEHSQATTKVLVEAYGATLAAQIEALAKGDEVTIAGRLEEGFWRTGNTDDGKPNRKMTIGLSMNAGDGVHFARKKAEGEEPSCVATIVGRLRNKGKEVEQITWGDDKKADKLWCVVEHDVTDKDGETFALGKSVNVIGKGARAAFEKVNVGDAVTIEGAIVNRSWEEDGVNRYDGHVQVDELRTAGNASEDDSAKDAA